MWRILAASVLVLLALPACGPMQDCTVAFRGALPLFGQINATVEFDGFNANQQCADAIGTSSGLMYLSGAPGRFPLICERSIGPLLTMRVRDSGSALVGAQICAKVNEAVDLGAAINSPPASASPSPGRARAPRR